jgi:hypothetical protein
MTDIVLLTRDPESAPTKPNWVLATQEENPQTGTPWRSLIWGKGRMGFKGTSLAEADNSLDDYIANRKSTGYVEQVRVKIYFPMAKIVAFVEKNTPKLIALAKKVKVKLS